MTFKKNDKVWVNMGGDKKPAVVVQEHIETPKVNVEFTNVLSKKKSTMNLTISNRNLSLRDG